MSYILKSETVIFMDPKTSGKKFLPELYRCFKSTANTIDEWTNKFTLISSSDASKITKEHLAGSEAQFERASVYKTPTKSVGTYDYDQEDILPNLGNLDYQKVVTDPETFAEELQNDLGMLCIARIVGDIESRLIGGDQHYA